MAVMRAQVSLMFDDADLFDNFIIPCKEERRLNGIIVKCLKAYYNDARVRSMVEGEESEDETEMEGVQSTQSICDSIRASLVMQDYLVEELKNTVDNGMEDVENILSQANKTAEAHGFGASYQTKSGSTILQLEAPKKQAGSEQSSGAETATSDAPNNLAAILCQAVLLLAKDANNSRVTALLQQAGVDQPVVAPAVATETARQTTQPEVPVIVPEQSAGFSESASVVDLEEGNDFDEVPSVPAKPTAESDGDATDAMKDLFGSL